MLVTSNKNNRSSEIGLFQQIVLFSAGGLTMSTAFILVGGLQILYPWV